jgi:hypothetical protein
MKTFTAVIEGYTAKEIYEQFPEAFENIKQGYLEAFRTPDYFSELCTEPLKADFPNSDFFVNFLLCSCQGDGVNIEGDCNLYDFVNVWNATEKEKRTMIFYIDRCSTTNYSFYKNRRYSYSCKDLDRKYIDDDINELVEDLQMWDIRGIKTDLISRFYNDLINYFAQLDKEYEENGYNYFYEAENEEIFVNCDANYYYFTKEGGLI